MSLLRELEKKWRDEAMYYEPQSDARRSCVNHADDLSAINATLLSDEAIDRALSAIWRPQFSDETKTLMRASIAAALKETP